MRYCEVSRPWDLHLNLSDHSEIWQAPPRQNCRMAMRQFTLQISRLRGFARSHEKTSYSILKWGPGCLIGVNIYNISRVRLGLLISNMQSRLERTWKPSTMLKIPPLETYKREGSGPVCTLYSNCINLINLLEAVNVIWFAYIRHMYHVAPICTREIKWCEGFWYASCKASIIQNSCLEIKLILYWHWWRHVIGYPQYLAIKVATLSS